MTELEINPSLMSEFFSLDEPYRLITLKSDEADFVFPKELDPGQDYYYTYTEEPLTEKNLSWDLSSEGVRYISLNAWVCEEGKMSHTYPKQSLLFRGMVDSGGNVYRIEAESSHNDTNIVQKYTKLGQKEAETLLDLAVNIKKCVDSRT